MAPRPRWLPRPFELVTFALTLAIVLFLRWRGLRIDLRTVDFMAGAMVRRLPTVLLYGLVLQAVALALTRRSLHVVGAVDLPVLGYHFPPASQPGIPVDLLPQLPIAGLKDSTGDPVRLAMEAAALPVGLYTGSASVLLQGRAMGCSGAILAPIVIGVLVGMSLPLQQNFMAIAIPAVIAVLAVSLIDHRRSASAQAEVERAAVGAAVKQA